jgi:hypothetical protein
MQNHTKREELAAQARLLSLEDAALLLEDLIADVRQRLKTHTKPSYNVLDFEGIGSETWKDVDIDEYIKQERASWDG